MPHGHCMLPADDAGRILDRLAGLEQVIPPEAVRQALEATVRTNQRQCRLTHEVVCGVVLAMGLLTDVPIRQVFKHARRLRIGEETPTRSRLGVARQRLGIAPVRHLFMQVVGPLARPETPGAFSRGFRLMGLDGVVFDVPDSDVNAAAFGRPSAGPRGEGAFPQIRTLSLVELGTDVEVAFVVRPITQGEQGLVGALLRPLDSEMLLVWDRGFFRSGVWNEVTARGVTILARVTSRLILKPIGNLADGSSLATIDRTPADRQKDCGGIVVRVIRDTWDDPQRVGHGEVHTLITNRFNEELDPAKELILLYPERGEEELVFDEQKTHQDPRRATKPADLRSETPAGVIQEIDALSLGHFVIRSLRFEAAGTVGLDPDRLSFLGCFQILKCRLPECQGSTPQKFEEWSRGWLWEMQRERTDDDVRRNRINPRVVKQKMSKFKKKRPEHRRVPSLNKTFVETVVMVR